MERKKAVLFDRDGTLNVDTGYLHRIEDLQWVKGARELIGKLTREGWTLIVVTNQSGVARGYYTEEDVRRLHEAMNEELARFGGRIEEYFYCPHLVGAPVREYDLDCEDRKPRPGMILKALAKYHLDTNETVLIGDSPRDVEAAEAGGIRGLLFDTDDLLEFWNTHEEEISHG